MAIPVDSIVVPPLKITAISPSLIAVSIDEPEPVSDDEAELEKVVVSSATDLD